MDFVISLIRFCDITNLRFVMSSKRYDLAISKNRIKSLNMNELVILLIRFSDISQYIGFADNVMFTL